MKLSQAAGAWRMRAWKVKLAAWRRFGASNVGALPRHACISVNDFSPWSGVHLDTVHMRLRPSLFWQARALDSHLPLLLPVCRDLQSARNELRWLSQHVDDKCRTESREIHHNLLSNYVRRRARGEPLQYLLGSEWFGDLKLCCRPGVLIPRFVTTQFSCLFAFPD